MCLPVRDLDLGYSLVSTHDREGIYILVDHDEEDVVAHDAPINNIYAPGAACRADSVLPRRTTLRQPRRRPSWLMEALQAVDLCVSLSQQPCWLRAGLSHSSGVVQPPYGRQHCCLDLCRQR